MGSWKDPASGEWLHTCTIITGEPNEFVREIHTRMPVIRSITKLGLPVNPEKRFSFNFRRTE
jgi:hypothetical protein